jgi:hypothetical protein
MKIEKDDFYSVDKYTMTYEEIPIELQPTTWSY